MTTSIKNIKNNVCFRTATEMIQTSTTFTINIVRPTWLTKKELHRLHKLNGIVSHGVTIIVND